MDRKAAAGMTVSPAVDKIQRDDDPPDPPDPPSAREKEKPGGPFDFNDKGFTCGIGPGGKFTCNIDPGMGDPLQITPGSLGGGSSPPPSSVDRPKNCPPERWNWMWSTCCPPDKLFDPNTKNCVGADKPSLPPLPPAPPPEYNDLPGPPNDGTAVA